MSPLGSLGFDEAIAEVRVVFDAALTERGLQCRWWRRLEGPPPTVSDIGEAADDNDPVEDEWVGGHLDPGSYAEQPQGLRAIVDLPRTLGFVQSMALAQGQGIVYCSEDDAVSLGDVIEFDDGSGARAMKVTNRAVHAGLYAELTLEAAR